MWLAAAVLVALLGTAHASPASSANGRIIRGDFDADGDHDDLFVVSSFDDGKKVTSGAADPAEEPGETGMAGDTDQQHTVKLYISADPGEQAVLTSDDVDGDGSMDTVYSAAGDVPPAGSTGAAPEVKHQTGGAQGKIYILTVAKVIKVFLTRENYDAEVAAYAAAREVLGPGRMVPMILQSELKAGDPLELAIKAVNPDAKPCVILDEFERDLREALVDPGREKSSVRVDAFQVDERLQAGLAEVVKDLVRLHDAGIAHNDIHGGNVALTRDGVYVLHDWGEGRFRRTANFDEMSDTVKLKAAELELVRLVSVGELPSAVDEGKFARLKGKYLRTGEAGQAKYRTLTNTFENNVGLRDGIQYDIIQMRTLCAHSTLLRAEIQRVWGAPEQLGGGMHSDEL